MRKVNRNYVNGYQEKIRYWFGNLQVALAEENMLDAKVATEKLNYFVGKQLERNGG